MRSGNPGLNENTFRFEESLVDEPAGRTMTHAGTGIKAVFLLGCVVATASWSWHLYQSGEAVQPWMLGGLIGGIVFALITIFVKKAAPITGPCYALCEGLFLGAISAMFEERYPGMVLQAVGLTFGVLFVMLLLYTTQIIKVTQGFAMGVVAATGGVALVYFVSIILGMFGTPVSLIHGTSGLAIGFSVVVVIIAALNLALDFALIDQGVVRRSPKYMEWYAAFALMLTLIWLYLEILRLLSKLNRR